MTHHFLNEHQRLVDTVAWLLAGVAVTSVLSQIAIIVTILSGLGSLSLVWLRWREHLKKADD